MVKIVIISILSFVFGFFVQAILERIRVKEKHIKLKPLSTMTQKEFKQAIRDLEIK